MYGSMRARGERQNRGEEMAACLHSWDGKSEGSQGHSWSWSSDGAGAPTEAEQRLPRPCLLP